MNWTIEQIGPNEWVVSHGATRHFARDAESAVELYMALVRGGA